MVLTKEQKWDALVKCDKSYDGKFLYGVKTTGIFCRPSCKSKVPLRKNVEFFNNLEEAYAYGLRPCKRCRPDLFEYKPMLEVIKKAKNTYDTYYDDSYRLSLEVKQLNISQNHLIRLFHNEYGMTPTEYINKLRVDKAIELITDMDMNILNIATSCGFGSLSNFYACFKKQVGLTPNTLRRRQNDYNFKIKT